MDITSEFDLSMNLDAVLGYNKIVHLVCERDFHVLRNQMNKARKCTKRIIASLLREIG